MTARVELTDTERENILSGVREELWTPITEAVESIVAARVAEALRDAAARAMPISGYMGNHRWISSNKLRDLADEYDPKGDNHE